MAKIRKAIHRTGRRFDAAAGRFLHYHPVLGYLATFIGLPLLILAAVSLSTTVIVLPFAFLFGWFPY